MKFRLTLIFHVIWSNCTSDALNECIDQEYTRGSFRYLRAQFRNEFPRLSHLSKTILGKTEEYMNTSNLNEDTLKGLCACAIYKVDALEQLFWNRNSSKCIETLKNEMVIFTANVYVNISYILFKYHHPYSITTCKSGDDVVLIMLGLSKKSYDRRVYNIYVGYPDPYERTFFLQGFIKDVDVDGPVNQPFYDCPQG